MEALRFFSKPIICPNMDKRMGKNIISPDLIWVPGWSKNKLGNYYLFFSDHKGTYIRMAFADNLIGPRYMHSIGVMELKDSGFTPTKPAEPLKEHRPLWAKKL